MKPNIVLLLIDSLRTDKFFGPQKTSFTPNLDKMTKNGTYFEQAISSSDATLLSWASMFTGNYAFRTGIKSDRYNKLDSSVTTYFEIFKKTGYHLYSYLPYLSTIIGLFPQFENQDAAKQSGKDLSDGLGNKILELLRSNKMKEPWFYYIHINDLHYPISVPDQFSDKKFGESKYEQQMSAIDVWIGKIIEKIDLKKTLVILTSDHGEYIPIIKTETKIINLESSTTEANLWKLGNKVPANLYPIKKKIGNILRNTREKIKSSKIDDMSLTTYQKRVLLESRMGTSHRSFDDLLRVPLIFSGFNIPNGKIISQQVRHVDIFPTVSEIISLKFKNNIDGISLFPLMMGKELEELPASIENPPTVKEKFTKSIGVRTSNYKYIRDVDNSKIVYELYDLKNDPLEEKNIIYKEPDIATKMEDILLKIRQTSRSNDIDDEKNEIVRENLRKLGYI